MSDFRMTKTRMETLRVMREWNDASKLPRAADILLHSTITMDRSFLKSLLRVLINKEMVTRHQVLTANIQSGRTYVYQITDKGRMMSGAKKMKPVKPGISDDDVLLRVLADDEDFG